ncbi:MAG TPA: USH1C-binding protein 1 [Candidatus Avidesulfovibrio excrementigallinarum]|nr:USH1C-binding protein 1 [Candidatus Avidesulfovibrio excrementigallinarum]
MSLTVDSNSNVSSVTSADLGPSSSLQLMFAKLQLELSETAKSQALERMDYISQQQEEQKLVSSLLNEARQAKADAGSGIDAGKQSETYSNGKTEKNTKNCTLMSQEMVDYMDEHGLAYDKTGDDYNHSEEEWDVAIASLEARLEELGTDTQQQMVYIQDYMGQYNSYLQGANTQISNANQTLTSLARGQ